MFFAIIENKCLQTKSTVYFMIRNSSQGSVFKDSSLLIQMI
jgi:hypothetical protein